MRLAVLSDIHGNLVALDAVLADLRESVPEGFVAAGDLVGGPWPDETIRRLSSLGAFMIRGNVDAGVVKYGTRNAPDEWLNSRQAALKRWAYDHLDEETFALLKALPEQRRVEFPETPPIRVAHGSPRRLSERVEPDRDPGLIESVLAELQEPVLVCGHTHRAWQHESQGKLALNPGAVSGPLDGTTGAQYALLTWHDGRWSVEHRQVDYDLDEVRSACRERGLLEEGGALARAMLASLETGRNVVDEFLGFAREQARRAGIADQQVIPDEVWDRAERDFFGD